MPKNSSFQIFCAWNGLLAQSLFYKRILTQLFSVAWFYFYWPWKVTLIWKQIQRIKTLRGISISKKNKFPTVIYVFVLSKYLKIIFVTFVVFDLLILQPRGLLLFCVLCNSLFFFNDVFRKFPRMLLGLNSFKTDFLFNWKSVFFLHRKKNDLLFLSHNNRRKMIWYGNAVFWIEIVFAIKDVIFVKDFNNPVIRRPSQIILITPTR